MKQDIFDRLSQVFFGVAVILIIATIIVQAMIVIDDHNDAFAERYAARAHYVQERE